MTENYSHEISRLDARLDKVEAQIADRSTIGVFTNRPVLPTKHDHHFSLIVVIKDDDSTWVRHDETIACRTMSEAKEKMIEIQKRTTDHKRKIVICQQVQESKNFGEYK